MKLALVEVYEVASFYAHFDIVLEGEAASLDRDRIVSAYFGLKRPA